MHLEIKSEDLRHAFRNLGRSPIAEVEAGTIASLLEEMLRAAVAAGRFDRNLLELLDRIKIAMELFWRDTAINVPLVAKKDISHNRRLLFYIERLLFPELRFQDALAAVAPLYRDDFDEYDVFVLLCAVYLHDYGKGQYLLAVPELPKDLGEKIVSEVGALSLSWDLYGLVEQYHSLTLDKLFQAFLDVPEDRRKLVRRLKDRYHDSLGSYIEAIEMAQPKLPPKDGEEAQKQLFWVFWQLCHLRHGDGGDRLLKEIQVVCRAHKSATILDPGGPRECDSFESIPAGHTKLISALLRMGDNLDLTQARLESEGVLPERFRHWIDQGSPENAFSENYRRLFRKWVTFHAVARVDIRHCPIGEAGIRIEIVLVYKRFWHRHLVAIRKQVEKDFHSPHFLAALERQPPEGDIELQLLYEIQAADDEGTESQVAVAGDLERTFAARSRPRTTPHLYTLIRPEGTEPASSLRFSPLPDELELPTNRALLYLIASLDSFGGRAACDRIARDMGLPEAEELARLADGGLLNAVPGEKPVDSDEGDHGRARSFLRALRGYPPRARHKVHELVELAEGARGRMQMLLRAFRAHPALVRQKVHEYEQLGYFLPFSLREFGSMPTGIDGLAKILAPSRMTDEAASGFKRARNILVVGGPGSGKTTLLVQILHHNLLHANRNVLMLTFEELTPVLAPAYHDHFGWRVDFVRSVHLDPQQDPGDFLATVHRVVRAEEPDLVAIDGLSRLRWAFPEHYRDLVDSLFKSLQVRGITSISSIEDPQTQGPAEEYQADGVVHLSQDGEARHLWIEKLRGQDYVAGMHAFEILDRAAVKRGRDRLSEADQVDYPFQPGINVYPNEQYYAAAADAPGAPKSDPVPKYIKTGVKNLDLLLPGGQPKEDGYRRGDAILVLGSPGAGKTLFGLHFLQADLEAVGPSPSPRHRVLWMSFEGPRRLLERSVASFDSDVGFQQLLKRPEFLFEFVPPALISPEKVFYHVTELVRRFDIGRIVIDSVSEIEEAFPNEKRRFRQYMTTFIHTLACRDVSSMFLYRVSGFFRTSRESESDIATLVDTIISIKTFDMKNKIRRGLFVLKSRGRELRSQLQTMDIHMKYGIQLSSKGWEMEGLLSGETGSIHEPEIFLKHFYENPAESRINVAITREFKRRYPKGRFTEVRKPAIHSEFWSFRGHYGAGHANIRVISISRYMVEAFRERDSLHALEDLFPEKLQEQIRKDERWSRYATEAGGYDSIPMYIDMGFLVARRDLAGTLLDRIKDAERPEPSALFGRDASGTLRFQRAVRWEDLTQLAATVNELNSPGAGGMDPPGVNEMGSRSPYVFALPYLYNKTEFMAFFFELLWSKGGDIYHFPIWDGPRGSGRDAFYKEQIFLNRSLWLEVRQIVIDAKDGKGSLYSLEELRQRIRPFLGALLPGAEGLTGETAGPPVEDQLVRWIDASVLGNPVFSIQNEDVITIKNRFGCEALAHLYDLVYDAQNSIPNPYDGEFRSASVFSRHWYSQIQGMRDEAPAAPDGTRPDVIEVLPLPSFSNGEGHRRSCTCETVWCLGVVREALSPEIGWIFIDTLTSKEWVEKRSKLRSGFPYNLEEIKSMERFDMGAYKILREIVDNKRGKDRIYDAQRRLVAPESSPDEVSKAAKDFFDGRYHLRDVADVLDYFGRHPDYEERREAFERGVPQGAKIHGPTSELSDFEDFGEDTGLRSKLPDHRPMFHRVESILHDEIVRLFSPQGRRDWYAVLGTGSAIAGTDEEIDRALKARREDQTENGLIARSLSRIHDRLVFELLISMPGELKKLLQQKTPQGDVPPR